MLKTLMPWTNRVPTLANWEPEFPNLMERLFGPEEWLPFGKFVPHTNVAETPERVEVTVELPGMKAEEIHVEMRNGELWIAGEKKEEKEEKGKAFHRVERRYGEFRRMIPLPATVVKEKINAEYKEGVLKVVIPKTEEAKPRNIEVKT